MDKFFPSSSPDSSLLLWDDRMLSLLSAEGAIKKHLRTLGYSPVSCTVSTATILGPSSGLPVGYLKLQSKDMQTQTGAFKVILWLVFLEVLVPSGFWKADLKRSAHVHTVKCQQGLGSGLLSKPRCLPLND